MSGSLLDTTSLENIEKLFDLHERCLQEINSRATELYKYSSYFDGKEHNKHAKLRDLSAGLFHFDILYHYDQSEFGNFFIRSDDFLRKDYLSYAKDKAEKYADERKEFQKKLDEKKKKELEDTERQIYEKLRQKFEVKSLPIRGHA